MRIESCNLGCSGGAGGTQVSCGVVQIYVNTEIRVRFTQPVDPSSLSPSSFSLIDVNSGQVPAGSRFVDPADPNTVVFRPALSFDGIGGPVFGFGHNTTYRVMIPGASQGDSPPYVTSLGPPSLPNRTRMLCTVIANLGIETPAAAFCAGDGTDPAVSIPCPCNNQDTHGRGCDNSQPGSNGALFFALGATSPDSVVLYATYEPASSTALVMQSTQSVPSGIAFGDGIRCLGGRILRLGVQSPASGVVAFPGPGDPSITARSAALGDPIAPGSQRFYQTWYSDPDLAFCPNPPGDRFNATNAVSITW